MGSLGELNLAAASALAAVGLLAAVFGVLMVRARRQAELVSSAAEERQAEVGRRLAGVLAAGRDGLVLHSGSGEVLEINDAGVRMLDLMRPDVVGRAVTELPVRWWSDAGQEVAPAAVFARRSGAGPQPAASGAVEDPPFVVGAAPATGAPVRWVQVSTRTVAGAGGSHELLTTLADMTGPREIRAALARSETQFRAAMENAPIGMVLVDPQWRIQQVNNAFAELLGTNPSALIGRDMSALSHPDDRGGERAHVQRLLAGESHRFTLEKRYVAADGQAVWAVLGKYSQRLPQQ